MRTPSTLPNEIKASIITLGALVCLLGVWVEAHPQTVQNSTAAISSTADLDLKASSVFRIETVPVPAGGDVVTIFARQSGSRIEGPIQEIPLISIFRDSLGDQNPDNDRLRYVWMLSYTKPTLGQKMSAFVPFLYRRTANKGKIGTSRPPAILDMQASDKAMWNTVLWLVLKKLVLSEIGLSARASALQYRENVTNYRKAAVAEALTVLSMYQGLGGETVLSDAELNDIQARLSLSDKMFGWRMQPENLGRAREKEMAQSVDARSHNWELLRQYSEAQSLYFEPLQMIDGTARHAIVWASLSDVRANQGKSFDSRFLNIKSPWSDPALLDWKGYSETRWFDKDDRVVQPETPGARAQTMIPLAIYGLDHPRIPVILVDFRNNGNPKFREMSKRVLSDITSNVLGLSQFSSLPYFVGRTVYDFVTGRRGMDINQPSRLRAYSQLKLLLSLDESLKSRFRNDISRRVESSSLNPLQNDFEVEADVARAQYKNLIDYAVRPDGLSKNILEDRREEMVRLKHGTTGRSMLAMAHVFTLGVYTHREDDSPQLRARLDVRRQLDQHERFLRETVFASSRPEIDSDLPKVKRSLAFIAQNGSDAKDKTSRALAKIFSISLDDEVRSLCLSGLYRINNVSAKKELLAIYNDQNADQRWRDASARYLSLALKEGQRMTERDTRSVSGLSVQTIN